MTASQAKKSAASSIKDALEKFFEDNIEFEFSQGFLDIAQSLKAQNGSVNAVFSRYLTDGAPEYKKLVDSTGTTSDFVSILMELAMLAGFLKAKYDISLVPHANDRRYQKGCRVEGLEPNGKSRFGAGGYDLG